MTQVEHSDLRVSPPMRLMRGAAWLALLMLLSFLHLGCFFFMGIPKFVTQTNEACAKCRFDPSLELGPELFPPDLCGLPRDSVTEIRSFTTLDINLPAQHARYQQGDKIVEVVLIHPYTPDAQSRFRDALRNVSDLKLMMSGTRDDTLSFEIQRQSGIHELILVRDTC